MSTSTAAVVAALLATLAQAPQTVDDTVAQAQVAAHEQINTAHRQARADIERAQSQATQLAQNVLGVSDTTVTETIAAPQSYVETNNQPEVVAPAEPAGVWDSLAQCESGGNWAINTGNGFHGGLQFAPSTWTGFGGGQYAPYAHMATREQQIDIAKKVQAVQGWGAWPACTAKLGIR